MILRLKAKFGKNKHVKDVIKGSSITFLAKITGTGLGLISSLIIARYYGADVIGIIAIINSVLAIFTLFGLMGTNVAILRLIPEYIEKYSLSDAYAVYKKILALVFLLSFFGGITLYFFAPLIATLIFKSDNLTLFLLFSAPFVAVVSLNMINTESIRGLQKIKLYALVQFLPSVFTVVLLILMTYFYYDKYNPVYIMFITNFMLFVILFFVVHRYFKDTKPITSKISTENIMNLSFPMFLTSFMHIVISQTDIIMLGIMVDKHEVGVYSIVLKLALLTSIILTVVNSMAAPKFSQLYHSGKIDDLIIVAQSTAKLIFYSTLPIIIVYVMAGFYILKIFGDEFTQGYYALIFLSIGQFINAAAGSVGIFLAMTGGQKLYQKIVMFGAVLNIVLNFILIPIYGINGAAIASMLSIVFWNIITAILIRRRYGFYVSYVPFTTI